MARINEESDLDETQGEKIEALQVSIDNLQRSFNNKIEYDAHKNKLFDDMHKELMTYKNGLVDKMVETLAIDIIQLVDSTKKHVSVYEDSDYSQENYKRLLNIVHGITQDLQDILYRQSIEPYSIEGDVVDVRKQKIIRTIETDDATKDNLIAERMVEGYEKEDRVIRPERIKIYKYSAKDSN